MVVKNFSPRLFLFFALFLAVACQILSPGQVQEVIQKTVPTVAQVATQAALEFTAVAPSTPQLGPETALPGTELRLPSKEDLRSYRSTTRIYQEGPFPNSLVMVLQVTSAWQKEPEPIFYQVIRSGNPLQLSAEIYQTAEGLYVRFGEDQPWNFLAGSVYEEALAGRIDQGALAFPTIWATMVGKEGQPGTYQGVPVTVYHWESEAPALLAMLPETWKQFVGTIDSEKAYFEPRKVVADVRATSEGWVLHAEVRFEGQWTLNGETSPGRVVWVGEVTDLNAPFRIALPEDLVTSVPEGVQPPLPLPETARLEAETAQGTIYSIPGMTVNELMDYWNQTQGVQITMQMGDANAGGLALTVKKPDGSTVQVVVMATGQGVRVLFVPSGGP